MKVTVTLHRAHSDIEVHYRVHRAHLTSKQAVAQKTQPRLNAVKES